jgi:hypothetical protein
MNIEHVFQAAAVDPYAARASDEIILKKENKIQCTPPRVSKKLAICSPVRSIEPHRSYPI